MPAPKPTTLADLLVSDYGFAPEQAKQLELEIGPATATPKRGPQLKPVWTDNSRYRSPEHPDIKSLPAVTGLDIGRTTVNPAEGLTFPQQAEANKEAKYLNQVATPDEQTAYLTAEAIARGFPSGVSQPVLKGMLEGSGRPLMGPWMMGTKNSKYIDDEFMQAWIKQKDQEKKTKDEQVSGVKMLQEFLHAQDAHRASEADKGMLWSLISPAIKR